MPSHLLLNAISVPLKTPTSSNAFDKADQLETGAGVGYEYDSLGERVKSTPSGAAATTYSYNQAGDLTAVKRAKEGEVPGIDEAFAYDGAGLMASRTVGESTNHLTWDVSGGLPLLLNDGQASYIYGPNGLPIEQIDAEEGPTYYHHDQLGSTRMLTNASGEATAKFSYGAYGGLEASTGAQTTPLGYAGQYTLAQSGLQYLRARVYDPQTGQFLTRDPVEAQTRQPYTYAGDNPSGNADPGGLEAEELKVPCTWPCAPPPVVESLEEAAHEIGHALEDTWNAIFGGESTEGHLTLNEAEEEYEEEHHECPLERNWKQDKKVTDQQLEEAGLDAHDLKEGRKGTDIYKDREGNLYEKPHGGSGPGEPLGININDRLR